MSYIFYRSVHTPFEQTDEMLSWAKTNCPSYITNDAVEKYKDDWYYRFHFKEEKDYMMFMLRWS